MIPLIRSSLSQHLAASPTEFASHPAVSFRRLPLFGVTSHLAAGCLSSCCSKTSAPLHSSLPTPCAELSLPRCPLDSVPSRPFPLFFDPLYHLHCRHLWQMVPEVLRKHLHVRRKSSCGPAFLPCSKASSAVLIPAISNYPLLGHLQVLHRCLQHLSRDRFSCARAESSFAPTGATSGMIVCVSPALASVSQTRRVVTSPSASVAAKSPSVSAGVSGGGSCPTVGRWHKP